MERYVVRDHDGVFFHDFTAAADKFDPRGHSARDRALDWAAAQSGSRMKLSVWREDVTDLRTKVTPVLVRRWPGQIIFAECLAH